MKEDYKQKPSGIWFIEFMGPCGERRRVSTGIKTARQSFRSLPPDVRQVLDAKRREIVLGVDPASQKVQARSKPAGALTMRDLFDRCEKTCWHPSQAKSQATIRSNLKILAPLIGHESPADMTYSRLEELVAELKARGYAPGTVKRKVDMVSKALRMATIWTDPKTGRPLLAYKPAMPAMRITNMKDRVVSRLEEKAVLNAIEQRRQDEPGRQWFRFNVLIHFLADVGARLGEATNTGPRALTVDGRPFESGHTYTGDEQAFVTFERYRTKNDKPRTVPLTARVWRGLLSLLPHLGRGKDGEWLFFPMTHGTAWYMWDGIREDVRKAGFDLDDVTLHTWRHTCLTRLAQGGMDILRLKTWAGHSDIKITAERYTHLAPGDLLAGVNILAPQPQAAPPIPAPAPAPRAMEAVLN